MPIEPDEVRHIAALSRLETTPEEADSLADDLQKIVSYIDRLQEVELSPDDEALTYFDADVHREDRTASGLERADALQRRPELRTETGVTVAW